LGKHAYIKNDIIWIPIDEYEGCELEPNTFTEINIHELAHKCKEWATTLKLKRYQLYSGFNNTNATCEVFSGAVIQTEKMFKSSIEPEAIFKACEWVRENKDV